MIAILEAPDRLRLESPRLALDLVRQGDRWVHQLSLPVPGQSWLSVASSFEWLAEHLKEHDPADHTRVLSPVYQDIRAEQQPDGSVILFALGKSGPHHFAATFHMTLGNPSSPQPETRIEVDVADRCSAPFEWLAATYTIHAPASSLSWATERGACWEWPMPGGLLVLESAPATADNQQCAVAEAGRAACRAQIITPANPRKATQRLVYNMACPSGPPTHAAPSTRIRSSPEPCQ